MALMLGVPFGSYLGDVLNWRAVFFIISVLGMIGLIGLMLVVPNRKPKVIPMLMNEWSVFKHKQVIFSFAITILGYSGVFIAYTFIEPILRDSAGFGTVGITGALFAYGLGGVAGNFFAGKVPLKLLTRTMIGVMIVDRRLGDLPLYRCFSCRGRFRDIFIRRMRVRHAAAFTDKGYFFI